VTSTAGPVERVERTGGVVFTIPSQAGYVSLVRMLISTLAYERRDLDDERVEDLVLAVSEAASLAIEAHGGTGDHPLVLRWSEDDERCEVEVVDRLRVLDVDVNESLADHVSDPGRAALEGNLGLPLVRALVDEVTVDSDDSGIVVRMSVLCARLPSLPDD